MKKNYIISTLMVVMILFGYSAMAQKTNHQSLLKKTDVTAVQIQSKNSHAIPHNSSEKPTKAVIWSDDFSVPANWIISNEMGNTDDWVIGTTGPSGTYAIGDIASTTAANGFALYDSDLMCSYDQIGNLTTANPINCTGHPLVGLKFEQFYARYYDSVYVCISTDNTNWTKFTVNPTTGNDELTANPATTTINISSVAGNQATVYVRFQFYSPSSVDGSLYSGCGYSWQVDDVSLEDLPSYDVALTDMANPSEYTVVPRSHYVEAPLNLSTTVENIGGLNATDVYMDVFVYNAGTATMVLSTTSNTVASMIPGAVETLTASTPYTPPVDTGFYWITYVLHMNEADADVSNDTLYNGFWISDSLYARSDEVFTGELDGALGITGTGTPAILGNNYTLTQDDVISLISAFVTGPVIGDTVQMFVYATDGSGLPTTKIAETDTFVFTVDGAQWVSLPIYGGTGVTLTAGTYFVGLKEFTTVDNIGLAYTDDNFTAGTAFAQIGATASFAAMEDYGYNIAYIIEPNVVCKAFHVSVSYSGSLNICEGESVTISALYGSTFIWASDDPSLAGQETMASITVTPSTTSSYIVTATDAYGCTASNVASLYVTSVNAGITVYNNPVCPGLCTDLEASTGDSYSWSTSDVTPIIAVCPVVNTTYTLTVTVGSCTESVEVTVDVASLPNLFTVSGGGGYCDGTSGSTVSLDGSEIGVNYQLFADGNAIGSNVAGTGNAIIWNDLTITGTYSVVASNATSYCTIDMIGSVAVSINPIPIADAGSDQAIPSGTSTTLAGDATAGTGPYTFAWSPASALVDSTQQNPTTLDLTSTTIFTLYVADVNGCINTDEITVTITGGVLSVTCATPPPPICQGQCFDLSTIVSGGTLPYSYLWSSTPTDPTLAGQETSVMPVVCPTETTLYTVDITDGTMTGASCSVLITVDLPLSSDTSTIPGICGNDDGTATMIVSGGTGTYDYSWNTVPVQTTQTATGLAPGTYSCTATDSYGCTIANSVDVTCVVAISEAIAFGNISIIPNPSDGKFNIQLDGYQGKNVMVHLTDIKGQLVYSEMVTINADSYTENMTMLSLGQGVYILQVISDRAVKTQRLVIE